MYLTLSHLTLRIFNVTNTGNNCTSEKMENFPANLAISLIFRIVEINLPCDLATFPVEGIVSPIFPVFLCSADPFICYMFTPGCPDSPRPDSRPVSPVGGAPLAADAGSSRHAWLAPS